jgi:hypothetical protein
MKTLELIQRMNKALSELLMKDPYLLEKDINERTIGHKLGTYLQNSFPEYDVDCEYNGNVQRDDKKKYIEILKDDLQRLGLLKVKEEKTDKEIIERAVFPDIIIHKRGSPNNLCIIEIKKTTSKIPIDYDQIKLKCYTSTDNGNDLNYELGAFIEFSAGIKLPTYRLTWYKNGEEISEEELISKWGDSHVPGINKFINPHNQLFPNSCIPSSIEMVLKLTGRVDPQYYDLQNQWKNRRDGDGRDFDGKTIKGLTFKAHHCPPQRGPDFPLQELFDKIDSELRAGRYIIVSLEVENIHWHNYIIYESEGDEYLAVTKGRDPEQISDVKSRIRQMQGTDIITFAPDC